MQSPDDIQIHGARLFSTRFDDHYASDDQPQAEKSTVFCEGNNLAERFAKAQHFTIAELGFGTGLGFLVTARLWLDTAASDATLDFYSAEAYPLSLEQLRFAQQDFPELAEYSTELQRVYSGENRGFHRMSLFDGRIRLTLMVCDIDEALEQLEATVDAWYLDGFSPAKNPQMWRPEIFQAMRSHSKIGSTFATYTAAGQVRRDLQAAGFTVKKVPGFGRKRERLSGQLEQAPTTAKQFPWRQRPSAVNTTNDITILGGGIAGCALANRLAARGHTVTIIEAQAQLAGGASANPVAIGHPAFTRDHNLASQLSLQGYLYTQQTLQRLAQKNLDPGHHNAGAVVLPKNTWDTQRQLDVSQNSAPPHSLAQWQAASDLSQHSGINITEPGWHFAKSSWVSLARLSRALVNEYPDRIQVKTNMPVHSLLSQPQGWQLCDDQKNPIANASTLVLANGYAMSQYQQVAHLPLRANRGQVLYIKAPAHGLKRVLRAEGYTVPLSEDYLCHGSSYDMDNSEVAITQADHDNNLAQLQQRLGSDNQHLNNDLSLDWSAIRTATSDRLPMIGQIAEPENFIALFGPMFRGEVRHRATPPPWHPGLHVFTGLGSHSVVYSLICAEALAASLCGHPSPLQKRLRDALDPNRFLLRKK